MSFYVKIIKSIKFVYITVCLQRGMIKQAMRYILPLILPLLSILSSAQNGCSVITQHNNYIATAGT